MLKTKRTTQLMTALGLGLIVGLGSLFGMPAAQSQPGAKQLQTPAQLPPMVREPNQSYMQDVLLVMPNAKAEDEEIEKALKEAHGTVIGTLGSGALKVLVIKTEKGKLNETEAKLTKNKKDFNIVQKNYAHRASLVPNDPQFASEWHLPAIQAQRAWDITQGDGAKIAVFDSGCQASVTDLTGKTDKGYNAHTWEAHALAIASPFDPGLAALGSAIDGALGSGARTDNTGHGTMVGTTAGASSNNLNNGAGVAPHAVIVPVKITDDSTALGDDLSVMAGLLNVMATHSAKIVNISYSGMTNPSRDPAMHLYFRAFHDLYGGIIFVSAGNDGAHMSNGVMSYVNVVSAVDPSLNKAGFSNWGNCVTFTAPGVGIVLTDRTGASVAADGTSFASPICAGIAALVWRANPGLSNTQVESIMRATAVRTPSGGWTPFFGFGMPDAFAAVRMARGV